MLTQEQIDRFWSKVDKSAGENECWPWTAGLKNKDEEYGGFYLFQINNTVNTHKLAFLLEHKFELEDIPNDIVIRHKCNNPICCNPKHLLLGTYKDNSQDMVKAGNQVSGERNCKAKLTKDQVTEIRNLWDTGKYTLSSLGDKFNINHNTIRRIVYNQNWKDENYQVKIFEDKPHLKVNKETIKNIREDRSNAISVKDISAKYKVSVSQIYNILNNKQRKGE